MITNHKILFISFFSIFIIVRKSIRTSRKKITVIMVTRKFHLVAAKKGSFDIIVNGYFLIEHDNQSLSCLSYAYVYVPVKNAPSKIAGYGMNALNFS